MANRFTLADPVTTAPDRMPKSSKREMRNAGYDNRTVSAARDFDRVARQATQSKNGLINQQKATVAGFNNLAASANAALDAKDNPASTTESAMFGNMGINYVDANNNLVSPSTFPVDQENNRYVPDGVKTVDAKTYAEDKVKAANEYTTASNASLEAAKASTQGQFDKAGRLQSIAAHLAKRQQQNNPTGRPTGLINQATDPAMSVSPMDDQSISAQLNAALGRGYSN